MPVVDRMDALARANEIRTSSRAKPLERSHQQRMDALRRANEIRTRRSSVKRDIAAGRVGVREVLTSGDPDFETWKIADVLTAVPKIGRTKTRRALTRLHVPASTPLRNLSEGRVDMILGELPV